MKRLPLKTAFFLITVSLALAPSACRKREAPAADNLILVTLDTQRADFLGCYTPGHAETPRLDEVAQRGMLFERAYSLIPITLPSHASMFFSLPPDELKSYNNGDRVEPVEGRPALAEIFRRKDFTTAAFVSLGVLQEKFGLAAGFDLYDGKFPIAGSMFLNAAEVNAKVLPWLRAHTDKRFFLWVHYSDPHGPYHPPDMEPELAVSLNQRPVGDYRLDKTRYGIEMTLAPGTNRIRFEIRNPWAENPRLAMALFNRVEMHSLPDEEPVPLRLKKDIVRQKDSPLVRCKRIGVIEVDNPNGSRRVILTVQGNLILPKKHMQRFYGLEVEYLDGEFGKLMDTLDELNLRDRTNLMIAGDHGEGLGEYINLEGGRDFGHINFLYDVYLRVPFILAGPGLTRPGARVAAPVTLLDLAPTALALMGMERPDFYRGRNLLDSGRPDQKRIVQATYAPQADRTKFAFLEQPWHLIYTPEDSLYELYDLDQDPEQGHNLYRPSNLPGPVRAMLDDLNAAARAALANRTEVQVDDKTTEMLKALGYIK